MLEKGDADEESILGKGMMYTKAKAWQLEGKRHAQGVTVMKGTGRNEEMLMRQHRLGIVTDRTCGIWETLSG